MDFLGYAESAASLLNTELADVEGLLGHLDSRDRLHSRVTAADVTSLQAFQTELRRVFDASDAGDASAVVRGLNQLLLAHPLVPRISDHDPDNLHLHVADAGSVADLLIGEALMGLTSVVCDLGATRLGVCLSAKCDRVFVDTSPNQSRRYCSERCSSRANVAAYRARQRAAAG